MFHKLTETEIWYYHNSTSLIMFIVILLFSILGYYLSYSKNGRKYIQNISIFLIGFCFLQEIVDHLNRFFWDKNYTMSWQRDLPIHFCHLAFYFSIYVIIKKIYNKNNTSHLIQFFFGAAFLLGLTGALQSILTPDITHIHNFVGVVTGQLQHSLILLNVFWLVFAYNMKVYLKDVMNSYLFINLIIPLAILLNQYLGYNSSGYPANYLYVSELPNTDNFIIDMISSYPFPVYLFYGQPILIIYLLISYLPFTLLSFKRKLYSN